MSAGQIAPPPEAATGLDLFAAAWVERWLHHGGGIVATPDGKVWKSIGANASDAPNYVAPSSDFPPDVKERRLWFDDGSYTRATRELLDLLRTVPGGNDAVAAHVRAFPSCGSHRDGWGVA